MRLVDAVPPSRRPSAGAAVLAVAVPLVFLHIRYQPSVALPPHATLKLQDVAVLAVGIAAAVAAARSGIGPLRSSKWIWTTMLLFLAWIVAATFYPLLSARTYAWRTHAVTAVEFGLYALLAPAVPLLVRRRADALLVLGALVAWSSAATVIGLVQWLGWDIVDAWPQGDRQPSFLGPHDFAALSGMALLAGIVGVFWARDDRNVRRVAWVAAVVGAVGFVLGGATAGILGPHDFAALSGMALLAGIVGTFWVRDDRNVRRVAWVAVVVGAVGFVLGGATAGILGLVPAAAIVAGVAARQRMLSRRTLVATLVTVLVASLGIVALRARDFDQFFRFLGVKQTQTSTSSNIQTYSQRTLLAYIGAKIWLAHPIAGAGWQGSTEPSTVGPMLPAAHRRFPDVAARAFPGPSHEYGIQILYVQVLADLGLIGFALMLGWLGVPAVLGARAALRAPPNLAWIPVLGLSWLVVALGLWAAFGLVAGVPLDALAWLAIGTVAAGTTASTAATSGRMPA